MLLTFVTKSLRKPRRVGQPLFGDLLTQKGGFSARGFFHLLSSRAKQRDPFADHSCAVEGTCFFALRLSITGPSANAGRCAA
jgi:hypothetical protein